MLPSMQQMEPFPGIQSDKVAPICPGAPNLRKVECLPVFGCAIPTVAGVRAALSFAGARGRLATWVNRREEPVLYIGGDPFVLRAAER